MKRITNNTELEQEILKLRAKKSHDLAVLKAEMSAAYEALKPSNMVKRIFSDLKNEPKLKKNTMQAFTSLVIGYISKRILIGKSNSFLKSILGYIVQIGATKVVSNKIITDDKQQ